MVMMIPTWKLDGNPFHIRPDNHNPRVNSCPINKQLRDRRSNEGVDDNDGGVRSLRKFVKELMEPELEELRSRVEEMRATVEHERKVRKRAERMNERLSMELVQEQGAREALERLYERLAREVSDEREAVERLRREVEEERRMMRMAEVLREERVQMKLADARATLEERIGKLEGKVNGSQEESSTMTAGAGDRERGLAEKDPGERGGLNENVGNGHESEGGGDRVMGTGWWPTPESKNPHIMRGIKGFVEFPRGQRAAGSRSGNRRSWGLAKVENHKAQIRMLLKQGSPVKSN